MLLVVESLGNVEDKEGTNEGANEAPSFHAVSKEDLAHLPTFTAVNFGVARTVCVNSSAAGFIAT